jgi:UDP-N-acetylmuramyl-tripeptide synthetase
MKLRDLIDALPGRLIGAGDGEVGAVRNDHREVTKGDVFVAVRGMRADGHAFVDAAVAQGAAAVVVEKEMQVSVPQFVVEDGAMALGRLVARSFGDPAKAMTLVGITGTNGKTTTSYLLESILTTAGHKTGVIGTVSYRWPGGVIDAPYTTPTPQILHGALAKMREAGCSHVVMEVTSFALSMRRVAGMEFAVAGFSNLTQDHLDVHGTMEVYRAAKRKLFTEYLAKTGTAVVSVDDPEGAGMAAGCSKVLRVSAQQDGTPTEIRVRDPRSTVRGITATIVTPRGELMIAAKPLLGHYNVENLGLAVGMCEALGVPPEQIARGIAEPRRARPGRAGRQRCRPRHRRRLRPHARCAAQRVDRAAAADDAPIDLRVRLRRRPRSHEASEDGRGGRGARGSRDRDERQPAHRRSARDHRSDPAGGPAAVLRRCRSAGRDPRSDRRGHSG